MHTQHTARQGRTGANGPKGAGCRQACLSLVAAAGLHAGLQAPGWSQRRAGGLVQASLRGMGKLALLMHGSGASFRHARGSAGLRRQPAGAEVPLWGPCMLAP